MNRLPAFLTRDKKVLLPVGVLIAIIAVVVGGILIFRGDNNQQTAKTPVFKDWLRPANVIKVGDFRYVSACQVLPVDQVEKAFGPFTGYTTVGEDYYSASVIAEQVPSEQNYAQTSCIYTLNKKAGDIITLDAYQYFDQSKITDDAKAIFISDKDTDAIIAKFEKASKQGSPSAQAFAKQMRKSSSAAKARAAAAGDRNDETGEPAASSSTIQSLNGSLMPNIFDFKDGSMEFTYKYNNVYYTLTYKVAPANSKKSFDQYSDAFVAQLGNKLGKAMAAINKNVANPNLSQSPAPTIISKSDTYGTTKLLEACSIAEPANFTAVFGTRFTNTIVRDGYIAGVNKTVKSVKSGDNIRVSSCAYENAPDANGITNALNFTLFTGPSTAVTSAWQKVQQKPEAGVTDTALQTNADSAHMTVFDDDPNYVTYTFQVGPYVGSLTPSILTKDDIAQPVANQQLIVGVINKMVFNLKRDLTSLK